MIAGLVFFFPVPHRAEKKEKVSQPFLGTAKKKQKNHDSEFFCYTSSELPFTIKISSSDAPSDSGEIFSCFHVCYGSANVCTFFSLLVGRVKGPKEVFCFSKVS